MSCHNHKADLVDLARGVDLGASVRRRVAEHLERCPECAAHVERERHLTAALSTLARSALQSRQSAVIEQGLLRAFASRQASVSQRTPIPRFVFATGDARGWLAAAALLVLAAAVWFGPERWRPMGNTQPVSTRAIKTPVELELSTRDATRTAATPEATRSANTRPPSTRSQTRPPRNPVDSNASAGDTEVLRFVALPAAAGLPGLESGRIVRMELPTAMLPAYGIDVVPEAAARVVEADVLVGQDGQPRAIRFVSLDIHSRGRWQ